jgi:hypothetical protein
MKKNPTPLSGFFHVWLGGYAMNQQAGGGFQSIKKGQTSP